MGWRRAGSAEADAFQRAKEGLAKLDVPALVRAVEDLQASYPGKYPDGAAMLEQLRAFEKDLPALAKGLESGDKDTLARYSALVALRQKALLSNPLLDFEQMLVVKRRENNLALPQNWQGNSSLNPRVENEICLLPVQGPARRLKTFYKPSKDYFVGDVDLNYDADKLLFSSIGSHNRWQVFEIRMDGTGLRQVTPSDETDIDSYDAVYLPDNRIIFDSTSTFVGVPCVGGGDYVANLHLMNPDGTHIRRLCFDQDNDWCPVVMASGRVMYLRWEYTDSAHYFARVLMSMNPDGTTQASVYHNNSYWPNGLWYARPLPGSPTKFVAIISGHHGVPRMGEMVLFDVAKGRQEDTGALQRIPGYGKPVKGIIKDTLVDGSWPKFLHPYPLSDKYFLVSCKPTPESAWGIYLVDVFDNMLLLKEKPGFALFEPLPLRKTERPPVIQDKVKLNETNATVYVHDIYDGAGLRGVPRGLVKSLRVFQYEYSYRNQGGHYFVGMEGGWDVRRMIGTVPVEEDGSAMFHIPANTPVTSAAAGRGRQSLAANAELVGRACRVNMSRARAAMSRRTRRPRRRWAWPRGNRRWNPPRGTDQSVDSVLCARCSRCWTSIASAATTASRVGQTCRTRRSFPRAAASPPCHGLTRSYILTCGATGRRGIITP